MKTFEAHHEKGVHPKLFTWTDLNNIINNPYMVRTGLFRVPALEIGAYRPPHKIKEWFNNEVCVLEGMTKCTKKVNALCEKFEEEYGDRCDAHLYVQKKKDIPHPFGIHYDQNQVIIVQAQGTTNYKVWDKVLNPEHDRHQNYSNNLKMTNDPILDVDLEPGDAVWIPRDYPHFVSPVSPKRLSISFCLFKGVRYVDREWIKL